MPVHFVFEGKPLLDVKNGASNTRESKKKKGERERLLLKVVAGMLFWKRDAVPFGPRVP